MLLALNPSLFSQALSWRNHSAAPPDSAVHMGGAAQPGGATGNATAGGEGRGSVSGPGSCTEAGVLVMLGIMTALVPAQNAGQSVARSGTAADRRPAC